MEPPSKTDKKLNIPNLPKFSDDVSVTVSLDYLRAFLVDGKFKIKDIEYMSIDWQVSWDRNHTTDLKRVPFLVVYINNPSHR